MENEENSSNLVNRQESKQEGLQLQSFFISDCWNFMFISCYWVSKPHDVRDSGWSRLSPTQLSAEESSAHLSPGHLRFRVL